MILPLEVEELGPPPTYIKIIVQERSSCGATSALLK